MPCDMISREEAEQLLRQQQMEALEQQLKDKSARIVRAGNAVSIEGWVERSGWCDACAVRKLKQSADFEVRRAINAAVPTTKGITFGHGH